MVGGNGETSYAANSALQRNVLAKAKFIVQEAVSNLYCTLLPEIFVMADMGCSSGPNTLKVVSDTIETIGDTCHQLGRRPAEVQFFLNDLPGNDFNTIFRSLPSFKERVKEEREGRETVPFYVVGVPGSFYGKLFPDKSIHLIHSSYSIQWLSQVPRVLTNGLNKWNIYISRLSPPSVFEAYFEQFKSDFQLFLELRSKEIIPGGKLVITYLGRGNEDSSKGKYFYLWDLLAKSLNAMVSKGILREEDVHTFNLPFYAPSLEEVVNVIQHEGSFELKRRYIFEINWDGNDDCMDDFIFSSLKSGEQVVKYMRAVLDSLLAQHFGEEILDELFANYKNYIAAQLMKEKMKFVNFVLSLEKKA
uniref:SAM:benzoic acid/salicylic acid carboxyl methyltransferase n=1 Tax=Lilium hybrid cultivar TaxID=156531 RepID=A0A075W3C7_9LILI|nr:SAM:benzoic acid/salicylic acid carboxyl methyltransferase [Lilium hybrid cultivar]